MQLNYITMRSLSLLLWISLLAFVTSCKEEVSTTQTQKTPEVYQPLNRAYSRTDTVRFTGDSTRMAVIGLLTPGAYLEDSSRQLPVDVLYYVKGKQVSAFTDTFSTRDQEELSHYFEGTDSNGNSCERFFTVTFGYPACGYNQSHLTFFADANNCYFVTAHSSSADGAYGGGLEFFGTCDAQSAQQITSAYVGRGAEEDTGDSITVYHSDSIQYRFDGKQWNAKPVTPKDSVYRTFKDRL